MSEILYSWEFNDEKNRGKMWYIIAISIVIGSSIWGFFTKQYGLSFIVLLVAGLYYFIENNSQDLVKIEITNNGINIDGKFYDYSSIDSFGFIYKNENPIGLRLNLNKKGLRFLDLKITRNNLNYIKNILSKNLEETDKIDLTLSEKFINLLKL
ncbi:hypothetical protein LRZ95_00460 [Candidatus Gracilibacteria bacterium]|nr:hypothetical protein [Candidatus Gracilibacteria bacterium]